MRGNSCQIERVLDEATTIKFLSDGKEVVSLLSSIQHCSKFITDQKRKECPKVSLLYQRGIPRSRGKLPRDEKDSFRIIDCLQKAPSLFLSTPHHRHDGPTHKKDNEQDRRNRMAYSMGN